jgi:hypothetical protein
LPIALRALIGVLSLAPAATPSPLSANALADRLPFARERRGSPLVPLQRPTVCRVCVLAPRLDAQRHGRASRPLSVAAAERSARTRHARRCAIVRRAREHRLDGRVCWCPPRCTTSPPCQCAQRITQCDAFLFTGQCVSAMDGTAAAALRLPIEGARGWTSARQYIDSERGGEAQREASMQLGAVHWHTRAAKQTATTLSTSLTSTAHERALSRCQPTTDRGQPTERMGRTRTRGSDARGGNSTATACIVDCLMRSCIEPRSAHNRRGEGHSALDMLCRASQGHSHDPAGPPGDAAHEQTVHASG